MLILWHIDMLTSEEVTYCLRHLLASTVAEWPSRVELHGFTHAAGTGIATAI